MYIHYLEMALSTQVLLLNFFFLADSYLFALDLFDGLDHHRIPLGLPSPYEIYPGMFNPPTPRINPKDQRHRNRYKPPFTSEMTTKEPTPKYTNYQVNTTEEPHIDDETNEDFTTQDPDVEREIFLMKNSKVPGSTDPPEENQELPEANTLSIPDDDPKLSVTLPQSTPDNETYFESNEIKGTEVSGTNGDGLSKNSDLILIPVNAVNPSVLNLIPTTTSNNNAGLISQSGDQILQPSVISLGNNINAAPYQPNTVDNGANNNVYTILAVPNNQNQPNNYYVQPNTPLVYNVVPLNNLPTGNYQPNMYTIINNQLVPVSNQPNLITVAGQSNFLPFNNQPINLVPVNNQPNNYVPVDNQQFNLVPVNNLGNNFVPIQPNNNQLNNYVPVSNQPNNVISLNNEPLNVIPINNAPSNMIPLNNQPNNYMREISNTIPVSSNTVPVGSNTIPVGSNTVPSSSNTNSVGSNTIPVSSSIVSASGNIAPANLIPVNNLQQINNINTNVPSNYSPNDVISLTAVATRDQDDDDEEKNEDVALDNQKEEDV